MTSFQTVFTMRSTALSGLSDIKVERKMFTHAFNTSQIKFPAPGWVTATRAHKHSAPLEYNQFLSLL